MEQPVYLFLNEKIKPANAALLSATNRSFRYGDGFFETMKYRNGKIVLQDFHLARLYFSLERMQFQKPAFLDKACLIKNIDRLVKKNRLDTLARIRLTIFAGDGSIFDVEKRETNVVIESFPLKEECWHRAGLELGFYPDAQKTCDLFSNMKSNNFLPYVMGALWAKQQKLHDAIILNAFNKIADTTIANIFILKNGIIHTPPLSDGCVAGVTRRYLLQCMEATNMPVREVSLQRNDMEEAAEVFLTNSIFGIRWVKKIGLHHYSNTFSKQLWKEFFPAP